MRRRVSATVLAVLTISLVGGCADEPTPEAAAPRSTGAPWHDEHTAGTGAGSVGAPGTACELPVAFPLPEGWKAEAVDANPDGEIEEAIVEALTKRGGTTAVCEVDGREQGGGFLRVWTADQPDAAPRDALETFVAAEEGLTDQEYREVRAGTFDAVEATWSATSELLEEDSRSWATAVRVGDTTVLLTVSESLLAEAGDILPAYRLATGQLAAAG
ncbi:hypothetical protein GA0070616_1146 [Micromonospora nigra]|uniref:Uncharacterized protein n=1 Tax=Micromonospora nigra TaxID=145857 RepID=A0A1C6RI96_9ACTN|nr:lipoprotein [Micromonospora nigra]SCL16884.1 hypothetical protein GA0070616_1146 [Micromonospora nigra]